MVQCSLIRQVTATCPSIRAHWWHLTNTIELVHPSAHSSPQSKRQMDRFSCAKTAKPIQLTTESDYTLQWAPLSTIIAASHRDLDLPCNTWCFQPMGAHDPNGTSIGSAVFAQMTAECLYSLQWFACFPFKIGPFPWTSCNTWFIGPTRVRNANGNLIVSAVSCMAH